MRVDEEIREDVGIDERVDDSYEQVARCET